MKNIIIIITALFLSASFLSAQDVIYLKDKQEIKAFVKSVNSNEITYVRFEGKDGPVYTIPKKKVEKIVYRDGFVENHNSSSLQTYGLNKNVISLNYGDLTMLRFAGSYERLFKDATFGIKIPYSILFSSRTDYYNDQVLGQTGIDLNFYPMGQTKLTYMTGVGTRAGRLRSNYYSYWPYYYEPFDIYSYQNKERYFFGVYVNNSLILHLTDNFSISALYGIGFRNEEGPGKMYTHSIGEMNVSLRF